jgi:hypothetical protein
MKTILRIIIVLLVASVVAGALSLTVNNTSLASGFAEGERPTITSSDGQIIQPMERPDGGEREGGSIAGGLGGVLVTLAKLTGITVLVLALQKGFDQINNMKKWEPVQQ